MLIDAGAGGGEREGRGGDRGQGEAAEQAAVPGGARGAVAGAGGAVGHGGDLTGRRHGTVEASVTVS